MATKRQLIAIQLVEVTRQDLAGKIQGLFALDE
jgi:hypothetical protein